MKTTIKDFGPIRIKLPGIEMEWFDRIEIEAPIALVCFGIGCVMLGYALKSLVIVLALAGKI